MTRPIELVAGDLLLNFHWLTDRYAHRIVAGRDDQQEVWESIDVSEPSPWPSSPPLQQVHVELRPGGSQVALAVGMSGRSHWSASFELAPEGEYLAVDVACRLAVRPDWLGSHYQFRGRSEFWHLTVEKPAELIAKTADDEVIPLAIRAVYESTAFPNTVRWQYRITRSSR